MKLTVQQWINFWVYFKDLPHQREAIEMLFEHVPVEVLQDDADWVKQFRDGPEPDEVPSNVNAAGIALIKEFEGCRLESYICPAGVWTIGFGHTEGVYPGQVITLQEAENMLKKDLWDYEDCVSRLINVQLNDNEYAALVSFAYNCGCGALQDSTMRRRLNAGEDKETVFRQELPKWVNGGGRQLPGLVRRRNAEIALACG